MTMAIPETLINPRPLNLSMPESSTSRSRSRARTADSLRSGKRWARTVEEDPWWPSLLCLDGGGIRGYSSLLILQQLMHSIHYWEVKLAKEAESDSLLLPRGRSETRLDNLQASPGADLSQSTASQDDDAVPSEHPLVPPEENLLPCHYFDFMFGTSTGGLIATMLGRLRMTVPECLALYRQVGDSLFGRRKSSIPLFTKYYHEPLERAVQQVVSARCRAHEHCDGRQCLHPWPEELARQVEEAYSPSHQGLPFDVDRPRICQSCCLTATHDEKPTAAYLLRTYSHYYADDSPQDIIPYNEGADPLKIWEVTRATSAAPFYFRMLETKVNGEQKIFKDGGIRENNPTAAALNEFNSMYYDKVRYPTLLLSIGTGLSDSVQDGFASVWPGPFGNTKVVRHLMENLAILRNVLIRYTDGETLHKHIRTFVANGEHSWYKRLNVDDGLQNMPLDDWVKGDWHGQHNVPGGKSLSRMEEATKIYLERDYKREVDSYAEPSIMIEQTAEKLVRQRRAREKIGGERWETFIGKHLAADPLRPAGMPR